MDFMVFLCTDSSTIERAYYKDNSSSEKLYELVIHKKLLETRHCCKIYISYVSGKRMIEQGTDEISRGMMDEGVSEFGRILKHTIQQDSFREIFRVGGMIDLMGCEGREISDCRGLVL